MTQKELLYVEDAVGHEQNIIKILDESLANLEDENLVSFMEKEVKEHASTLKKLIKLLEVKVDE
jgi:ppGpp synthetase/RelA/SpoT-type nucleotidyltranferase